MLDATERLLRYHAPVVGRPPLHDRVELGDDRRRDAARRGPRAALADQRPYPAPGVAPADERERPHPDPGARGGSRPGAAPCPPRPSRPPPTRPSCAPTASRPPRTSPRSRPKAAPPPTTSPRGGPPPPPPLPPPPP